MWGGSPGHRRGRPGADRAGLLGGRLAAWGRAGPRTPAVEFALAATSRIVFPFVAGME